MEKTPLCKSSILGRRKYKQSTSCLWAGWGVRWSVITLSGCDRIIHTEIQSSVFMSPSQRGPAWLLHHQPGNRLVTWPGLSSAWPLMMSDDVNKMIIGKRRNQSDGVGQTRVLCDGPVLQSSGSWNVSLCPIISWFQLSKTLSPAQQGLLLLWNATVIDQVSQNSSVNKNLNL